MGEIRTKVERKLQNAQETGKNLTERFQRLAELSEVEKKEAEVWKQNIVVLLPWAWPPALLFVHMQMHMRDEK